MKTPVNINEEGLLWQLKSQVEAHSQDIKYMYEGIERIEKSVSKMETNHLAHMQASIEGMHEEIVEMKISNAKTTPFNDLVKAVIQAVIIAIVIGIVTLYIDRK